MSYEAKICGSSVNVYKNGRHIVTKGGLGIDAAQVLIEGDFVVCLKKNGRVKASRINSAYGGDFDSLNSAKKWIKQQT